MNVIRAPVLGFCFGVKRAVTAAETALTQHMGGTQKIYTLGPLIHNPEVLASLERRGLTVIAEEDIDVLPSNATVIIRAHGTTPCILEKLQAHHTVILDETCPRVHASQLLAKEWADKGYQIIIAGDKNHGEVMGISGYADNKALVLQNEAEAAECTVKQNAILLAQTTFSPVVFEQMTAILTAKSGNLKVFNTICTATMERQNALKALVGKADGIIVIGGKNSANTRRLFETAQNSCPNAVLIENASQIPERFFSLSTIALTAGASTPDNVIDEVEAALTSNRTK